MGREINLCDGKYQFKESDDRSELLCLRHGKPWREFIGDKAVHALFDLCYQEYEIGRWRS